MVKLLNVITDYFSKEVSGDKEFFGSLPPKRSLQVLLGSKSDIERAKEVFEFFEKRKIPYDQYFISCHRNPFKLLYYACVLPKKARVLMVGGLAYAAPGVLRGWLNYFGKLNPIFVLPVGDDRKLTKVAYESSKFLPPGIEVNLKELDESLEDFLKEVIL
ncbi:MAG: hypothetical protein A2Y57_03465 [Candidatus Woykebacteria bacterium RBG_13_40_7b]|uniref:PurE domain-containing protein n=1 Tax=Candidatus Woykebacteria bacterium RBG_13_40_7b TaxID=1802594 RepID=A0A1G1WAM7_9BACT|nr:MAG: hypothetical protein A2Y57_03465 [Candidatus Woykebacteria bacterium RBG_13_40_7b]